MEYSMELRKSFAESRSLRENDDIREFLTDKFVEKIDTDNKPLDEFKELKSLTNDGVKKALLAKFTENLDLEEAVTQAQKDGVAAVIDCLENFQDGLLEGANESRLKLIEALQRPLTLENFTINGYDDTWNLLRSNLEALGTIVVFYDIVMNS